MRFPRATYLVACFQYKRDAQLFYHALKTRLAKYGLEVAEEKTRIIEFGRFAERDAKRRGESKPETFDFLGFTHYCGRSRQGRFKLKWKTARKKYIAKVKDIAEWIKENRQPPLQELWETINAKLRGHYQYYGVSDNWGNLLKYRGQVLNLLYKWLNRRSQRSKLNWVNFNKMIKYYPLAKPKLLINLNSAFV